MLTGFYRSANVPLTAAFGAEYPARFADAGDEYRALVSSCGVVDLTHRRVLRARGKDRAAFLHAMLTADIASLEPGSRARALMTTVKGKLVSELEVLAGESEHLVVVAQGDFDETLAVLRKHIVAEDVSIEDVSAESAVLGVEGPDSERVVHRLLGKGPLPSPKRGFVEREFEDFHVTVTAGSATGEPGYHVIAPAGEILRLRNYLVQAARGSDGLPVGLHAWDMRRVENGIPWYGVDFTAEHFPQEVRLGALVSYTKGCFRGQETLSRIHHRGHVTRVLVGLTPADDAAARNRGTAAETDVLDLPEASDERVEFVRLSFPKGTPIHVGQDEPDAKTKGVPADSPAAGWITSAVYSPALRRPLLMGLVPRECADGARRLFVETPEGRVGLRPIDLPVRTSAS